MATELHVEIVTPEASAFSDSATAVVLPAWKGELGVYPEHDQLLCLVQPGRLTVTTAGGDQRFVLGRGFAEIGPDRVTILTESCEASDAIDKQKASEALAAANAIIAKGDGASEAFAQAVRDAAHAQARIDG